MEEIWKPVKNFEGYYEVSSWGRVRSVDRYVVNNKGLRLINSQIIKQTKQKNGYLYVGLHKKQKQKLIRVHRLVAEAFLPNPENLPEIHHKSEVKTENNVENLQWVSSKQNQNSGTCIERRSKKKQKPVLQYTMDEKFIKEWPSIKDIEIELGIKQYNISRCCNDKRKSACGYIFKFKEKGAA